MDADWALGNMGGLLRTPLQVHLGPSYMQVSQPLQQVVKFPTSSKTPHPSFLQTTQSPQTSPEWGLVTCSLLLQTK